MRTYQQTYTVPYRDSQLDRTYCRERVIVLRHQSDSPTIEIELLDGRSYWYASRNLLCRFIFNGQRCTGGQLSLRHEPISDSLEITDGQRFILIGLGQMRRFLEHTFTVAPLVVQHRLEAVVTTANFNHCHVLPALLTLRSDAAYAVTLTLQGHNHIWDRTDLRDSLEQEVESMCGSYLLGMAVDGRLPVVVEPDHTQGVTLLELDAMAVSDFLADAQRIVPCGRESFYNPAQMDRHLRQLIKDPT